MPKPLTPAQLARKVQRAARQAQTDADAAVFAQLCQDQGIPRPVREHPVVAGRRFAYDFAWPHARLALEVEGGVHTGGRHTSGAGFERDMEKYNLGAQQGWRVLRVQPRGLCKLATVEMVRRALKVSA